ncbi:MAG: hypothetical protein AAF266_00800 [Planctomycetota bacterium]
MRTSLSGVALAAALSVVFPAKVFAGAAGPFVVDDVVTITETLFDWDGVDEDIDTQITGGGQLTINANQIDADDTHNRSIDITGGATPADAASLLTNIAQGWTLAGSMQIVGSSDGSAGAATYTNGVDNVMTIGPTGVVTLDGGTIESATDGTIVNEGTVQGNGLIGAAGFANNGLIRAVAGAGGEPLLTTLSSNFDLDGTNAVTPGNVEAIDGDLNVQGRLTDNFGGVATVGAGRTLDLQIGWILGAPATLNLIGNGSPATVDTSGINNGEINEQNGQTTLRGTVNVVSTGRILGDSEVRSNATINLTDSDGRLEFGGATHIEDGATFLAAGQVVNLVDGTMTTEDGLDFATATLINQGQLVVDGDLAGAFFSQEALGEVVLEIGGTLDSEYDQLAFDGFNSLAGGLTVEFAGGFEAGDGEAFSLLQGSLGMNEFDSVALPALAEGLSWSVDYLENELVISVEADTPTLVGDYNGDGLVNAADYTVWRDTLDSVTELAADGDGDGIIDQDDYDLWSANFGDASVSPTSVPEPASLLLVTVLALSVRSRQTR